MRSLAYWLWQSGLDASSFRAAAARYRAAQIEGGGPATGATEPPSAAPATNGRSSLGSAETLYPEGATPESEGMKNAGAETPASCDREVPKWATETGRQTGSGTIMRLQEKENMHVIKPTRLAPRVLPIGKDRRTELWSGAPNVPAVRRSLPLVGHETSPR